MKEFVQSACMFILDFLLFFFRYIFREFPCFSIIPVLTICCFVRGISFGDSVLSCLCSLGRGKFKPRISGLCSSHDR